MKAIIIIDVPLEDSIDFGHLDIRANVKVDAYNGLGQTFKPIEYKFVKVEPMPKKKELTDIEEIIWDSDIYDLGYNRCLAEILGEEE